MGIITIQTSGSFQSQTKTFRADHHGHADAVAQAIGVDIRPGRRSSLSKCYPGAASDDACYPRRMRYALDALFGDHGMKGGTEFRTLPAV